MLIYTQNIQKKALVPRLRSGREQELFDIKGYTLFFVQIRNLIDNRYTLIFT